ncbi:hypothetical protein ACFLT4_04070 [Chloroflexota bacterium]
MAEVDDLSAEQIADLFSKECQQHKLESVPTPRTIRNWLKKSDRIEDEKPVVSGKDPLVVKAREEYYTEIIKHDRGGFKKSDKILNEDRLDKLIDRLLIGNRFYLIEVSMLNEYLKYFEKESNKYVISELLCQCERCCKTIDRLFRFIEKHSDVVADWQEGLGTKYKLVPGGDFDRFYHELTNDSTRVRAETRLSNKADRLAKECRDAYKEYRSTVRETLYL